MFEQTLMSLSEYQSFNLPPITGDFTLGRILKNVCDNSHLNALKMLIHRGLALNADYDELADNKIIFNVINREKSAPLLSLLIESGADIECQSKWGRTPVFITSMRGHIELTAILMTHGAKVTAHRDDNILKNCVDTKNALQIYKIIFSKVKNIHNHIDLVSTFIYAAVQNKECAQLIIDSLETLEKVENFHNELTLLIDNLKSPEHSEFFKNWIDTIRIIEEEKKLSNHLTKSTQNIAKTVHKV